MDSFTQLHAWKTGMKAVREIYAITKTFPVSERFELTAQMRSSVTSILANLAEGFSRKTAADKSHKYTIARGECSETQAFVFISIELGYTSRERSAYALSLLDETGKMLTGLIQAHL